MLDTRSESAALPGGPDIVQSAGLAAMEGVKHAFFTRRGGVSQGIYASLNTGTGSGDDPATVRRNRDRAMAFLNLSDATLATPWQVHSSDVAVVDGAFTGERPRADAVVTATPGFAVGVLTADCGPVLLADAKAGVVGAAHAGWRGALGGVLEATITAMETLGARRQNIVATLGPTITCANYEVGAEMAGAFLARDPAFGRFFISGHVPGKSRFDLPGFIVEILTRAGVTANFIGRCTYGEEGNFFSFRRTTHRGEPDYGRQLSAIALDGRD